MFGIPLTRIGVFALAAGWLATPCPGQPPLSLAPAPLVQEDAAPARPPTDNPPGYFDVPAAGSLAGFSPEDARFTSGFPDPRRYDVGLDLVNAPVFDGGLILYGRDIAMKIGGFVKADFIYDFNPIDSTDQFDTTTIPIGAAPRTNARFHAKQTRLSFDTRWVSNHRRIRIFVSGDFFTNNMGLEDGRFRLRRAFGESTHLLVGKTFTTFTDVAAAPETLDFEGSVSAVNRRQALARWRQNLWSPDVVGAIAVEDTRFIIIPPPLVPGVARTPSPDIVSRIRLSKDWGQFQIANVIRVGGFQPLGQDMVTGMGWGLNFTGVVPVQPRQTKLYYQIVFGKGIGSYRGLPDFAPSSLTEGQLVPMFGWMVGATHAWTPRLSSNLTYAENVLDNPAFQEPDEVHRTTYLAANLIHSPMERVDIGIEYLYGLKENVGREIGTAHRIQVAFIFTLP